MPRSRARSILYRLIAAGQLAHQTLLAPALARGLEPGDDALLYLLANADPMNEARFADELGIDPRALAPHLARLIDRDLVERRVRGPGMSPIVSLTDRGQRLEAFLSGRWKALESSLLDGMTKSRRKTLSKQLRRVLERLEG